MNIIKNYLIDSDCYKAGQPLEVKGIMLHSVSCPQQKVVPLHQWNTLSKEVCTHAYIETGGDVYQTLPWDVRGCHCGSGVNGSANNTHIGIVISAPTTITYVNGAAFTDRNPPATKAHVLKTYTVAVELFVYLCRRFNLDPAIDGVILSQPEGNKRGTASNRGNNVEQVWSKFGLTMAQFRADIRAKLSVFHAPANATSDSNAPSDWAKTAWYWAMAAEIVTGANPRDTITCEQAVYMLYHANKTRFS